ncbi:MAG: alpha/beta fold hydrolase [Candidatus Woesearchaeota archaeon]
MPYFKSHDGTKIYYNYLNKKSNKPVLFFIHGHLNNWTCFRDEINIFKKENFPIIYIDLRGHGLSEVPEKDEHINLNYMIEDAKFLIDKLKIKKIVLIGHSLGGMLSLSFTIKYNHLVHKLIMIDSAYKYPDKIKFLHTIAEKHLLKKIFRRYFDHKDINVHKRTQKKIENDLTKEEKKTNPYIFFVKNLLRNNPETIFYLADEILNTKINNLNKVKCPVLLLGHLSDQLFSKKEQIETAYKLKKHLIKFFEGTHDSVMRDPITISQEIKQFIYTNKQFFEK